MAFEIIRLSHQNNHDILHPVQLGSTYSWGKFSITLRDEQIAHLELHADAPDPILILEKIVGLDNKLVGGSILLPGQTYNYDLPKPDEKYGIVFVYQGQPDEAVALHHNPE